MPRPADSLPDPPPSLDSERAAELSAHTKAALRAGVRPEELMEAIWVAAEMRAGAAYAHATIAMAVMEEAEQPSSASK